MSFQSDITSKHAKSGPAGLKKKSIWKWLSALVLFLLLLVAILAIWVWSHRYSVLERYVVTLLEDQGIEAELSIKTADFDAAVLENIKLTYQSEGTPFFTAKRIEADYVWKEALQGKMKRLRFVEPTAHITLDENFKIVDGWLPPKSESDPGGLSIPENGFFLEDATFDLETPYGAPVIAVSATIRKTDQFEAVVVIDETDLNYKDWTLGGSARVDLDVDGDKKAVGSLIRLQRLDRNTISLRDATLEMNGVLTTDTTLPIDLESLDMVFDGQIQGTASRLETTPFTLDKSRFDWEGQISRHTALSSPIELKGKMGLATDQFTFADETRAKDLAKTLTLSDALSKTPIAQHFAPSLTLTLEKLLQHSAIETVANIDFQDEKAIISLSDPLKVRREDLELNVKDVTDHPLYVWDRRNDKISLSFDGTLNRPVPLSLKDTRIEATSENGWQLADITLFSGTMATSKAWSVISDKERARLSPFKASIHYLTESSRRLTIKGGVDFTGRVPGGYVEGFKTHGTVNLHLSPPELNGLSLAYLPTSPKVRIDRLLTETDWDLENISLDLKDGNNIFALTDESGTVNAGLENIRFTATNKVEQNDFEMGLGKARAKGALDTRTGRQDWTVNFEKAEMKSDNFPVEDTLADVPEGTLTVQRRNESLTFDFSSGTVNVAIPQGEVEGLTAHIYGTPSEYIVEHEGGRFTSPKMKLPEWPVSGTVRLDNGTFFGQAEVRIPKANDAPLKIVYNFKEGAGAARAVLENLTFKPRELQPQTLAPALAGKIAAVDGAVSADMNIQFGEGKILESGGVLNIRDMNFGTAPGPVEGLNTQIEFSSLMPFQTTGRQVMTLKNFDPGIPLKDGIIEYELVPEGIKIYSAEWPLNIGAFALDPFTWRYGAEENRVVMRLNDISINELLQTFGNGKLEATGTVRGVFPIVIRGLSVLVDDGYLEAKDGGVIRFKTDEVAADDRFQGDKILETWQSGDEGVYNDLAKQALKEFDYRELTASINGPLDGDVEVGVVFNGANKNVLNGQPFEFDINVQGELFNILQSFNSNAQIKSNLLKEEAEKAR